MKQAERKDSSAFTIIEMIVVLAICAILASALVPFLLKARGEARRVVCSDNLSRLGIAINTVLPDESGYFSNCYYNVTQVKSGTWWVGLRNQWDATDPLVQADFEGAYACPSASGFVTLTGAKRDGTRVNFATTYAQNIELPIIASNVARVPDPSTRVILYDGDAASVVGQWEHTLNWPERTITPRHNGKANFLFLDGHVEMNGAFRAEPFHGCPMGRTPVTTQKEIEGKDDIHGKSDWVLLASVNIHPESNNINNKGNGIQCKITIPAGFGGGLIDTTTVYLVGAAGQSFDQPLPAIEPMHQSVGSDGSLIFQCKFDRQVFYTTLASNNFFGKEVPMRVVGQFEDGQPFEGIDVNCVFDPPKDFVEDPVKPGPPPKK
jgi:prepilin-type processing-associated H-X9-DG protein/prepilin-type N-terminal cleavage/methylation domain-containing protein